MRRADDQPGAHGQDREAVGLRLKKSVQATEHPGHDGPPRHAGDHDHRAATDRGVFLAYLDEVLCPKLRAGHVVVMDNLSAHKVEGVREQIEACGASVLYLPPTRLTPIRLKKHGPSSNRD